MNQKIKAKHHAQDKVYDLDLKIGALQHRLEELWAIDEQHPAAESIKDQIAAARRLRSRYAARMY